MTQNVTSSVNESDGVLGSSEYDYMRCLEFGLHQFNSLLNRDYDKLKADLDHARKKNTKFKAEVNRVLEENEKRMNVILQKHLL